MELPGYIRRPLEDASSQGLYHGHVVIGRVAPVELAWFAVLDGFGRIIDGVARITSEADYRAWADRLINEAASRGARLAVFELTDEQFSAAAAARGKLN